MNRPRFRPKVGVALIALGALIYALWNGISRYRIESRINGALSLVDASGNVSSVGTNELLAIGDQAVPVILQWSAGKNPAWYSISEKLFRSLGAGTNPFPNMWQRKENARKVTQILRARASGAVPILRQRLADPEPRVRRFSIHILGAIGPGIGAEAFLIMTNCLQDPDKDVRNDVIWALQFHDVHAYPPEVVLPVFLAGLKDTYKIARENAEIGLVRLSKKDSQTQNAVTDALVKYRLPATSQVWDALARPPASNTNRSPIVDSE